jgi:integrase
MRATMCGTSPSPHVGRPVDEMSKYARSGVLHAWLVDVETRVVTAHRLQSGLWRSVGKPGSAGNRMMAERSGSAIPSEAFPAAVFGPVQELLGHATIQMTMRYAHLAPQVTGRGKSAGQTSEVGGRQVRVAPWQCGGSVGRNEA